MNPGFSITDLKLSVCDQHKIHTGRNRYWIHFENSKKKIDTILIIKSNEQEHRPTHSDLEASVQLDGSDRVGYEQMQELV